jgi:hypothetical protein
VQGRLYLLHRRIYVIGEIPSTFFAIRGIQSLKMFGQQRESESYVTTDGQPASLSWNKAPVWGLRPDLFLLV